MSGRSTRPTEERFWSLVNGPWVDPNVGPWDDWLWMGGTVGSRRPKHMPDAKPWRLYGRFHWPLPGFPKFLINAHRAALLLTVGPPPDGDPLSRTFVAGHTCDVGLCIHPGHLGWQTQKQNVEDAITRGRLKRVYVVGVGEIYASTGVA